MNIKIVGNNSSNRIKLIKNVNKAMEEMKIHESLEISENKKDIEKYKISNTPALIISEKVISQGKILTDKEIKKYLKILA